MRKYIWYSCGYPSVNFVRSDSVEFHKLQAEPLSVLPASMLHKFRKLTLPTWATCFMLKSIISQNYGDPRKVCNTKTNVRSFFQLIHVNSKKVVW